VEVVATVGSVNSYNEDVVTGVVGFIKVSSNRFVSLVFGVSTMFQQSGLQGTFCLPNILLTTFLASNKIYNIGRLAIKRVVDGIMLPRDMTAEFLAVDRMLNGVLIRIRIVSMFAGCASITRTEAFGLNLP